ncbi:hypothetical protein XM38_046350 [Halomicronema hongdechloris C2206]|uniref:Uncharacterized protein n=2 Tax=Halomicronema hongdechloris TaxID=1209493 RepID=A0A1Z3HTN8_9CYAN|nr:hypothetical protein XM38_046350 [Halomicronema hongdechloris C2206]
MDEDRLAKQLAETGNIMDLCQDPAWLEETAQIEKECGGYVEAGLLLREYAMSAQTVTPDQLQQVRLQSVLFAELHQWMSTWQLGLSFEKTYTQARQIVRHHLQSATEEQAAWLKALLTEIEQKLPPEQAPVRSQTIGWFRQVFTTDDWQQLAEIAAQEIYAGVSQLERLHSAQTSSV